MISIGIGEIQKNISLLTKITETIEVIDKRKRKKVAVIYPVNRQSVISSLAGKYKDRVKSIKKLDEIKEISMIEAMRDKYDLPN